MSQHSHRARVARFGYPFTALYLIVMVTVIVALLASGANLQCRC